MGIRLPVFIRTDRLMLSGYAIPNGIPSRVEGLDLGYNSRHDMLVTISVIHNIESVG